MGNWGAGLFLLKYVEGFLLSLPEFLIQFQNSDKRDGFVCIEARAGDFSSNPSRLVAAALPV